MNNYKLFSLSRGLDIKNPTNRLIIILAIFTGFIASFFHALSTRSFDAASIYGLKTGVSVFLMWAIAREVDPDHDYSSFTAIALSIIGIIIFELQPNVLPLVWVLICLRIINQSVGMEPYIGDKIVVVAIAITLTLLYGWIFAALTALVFIINNRLTIDEKSYLLPVFMILTASISFFYEFTNHLTLSQFNGIGIFITFIVFGPVIAGSRTIKSKGDRSGKKLDPSRIRAAQLTLLISSVILSIFENDVYKIMWLIMIGIGIYWLITGKIKSFFN